MPDTYRVASPCVVRVAGLPACVLGELRAERTAALTDDLLDRDAWLAAEAHALSEALYAAIGALAGSPLKPRLVGLRRAVHSGRAPRPAEWGTETAGALPAEVAARVRTWVGALAERNRLAAALPGVLSTEVAVKTAALRRVASGGRFRHGLAHSSPTLSDELDKWLAGGEPDAQLLRRLARYVARAATKTSPYSTFTSTGFGRWSDGGQPLRVAAGTPDVGLLDLHGAVLPELGRALAARADLRGALRVRVNPSAVVADGQVSFLGAPPGEPVVRVAATPDVARLLVHNGRWYRWEALRHHLLDGSADPELAARVEGFLDRLAGLGLLEVRVPVPDQADDPLGILADWLDDAGGARYHAVSAACRALRAELAAPAAPDEVTGHRARLRTIQRRVGALGAALGLDWAEFGAAPAGAVHENAVFTAPVADLDRTAWRPALDDLDAVRRWLALHDPALPLRLALGSYCRERFGPGAAVPLLALHRAVREEIARGTPHGARLGLFLAPFPEPRDGGDGRVRELLSARRAATLALLSHPASGDGSIRLDAGTLLDAARDHPVYATAPESVACFVQPWLDAGDLRLVLNTMLSGHGRGRSRWLRLAGRAGAAAPEPDAAPDGRIVAEVSGVFGYPFNVRLPAAPYEIDYPHTLSDRPAEQRIPLGDLVVVHDAARDTVRLRDGRRDADVLVVHTGMQAEILLPPALQLLVRGLGASPTPQPPGRLLLLPDVPTDRVVPVPRVDVGRVTLQRAAWIVPHRLVPARAPGDTDAGYLLRLRGWLRATGVPERCFVQAFADAGQPRMTKARKPLYVDFADWFLVTVFERLLARPADTVVFREALPAPRHAIGARVSEVVVELTESGRG